MARTDAAFKKALSKIDAAKARTKATPLAGSWHRGSEPEMPLTRPAYAIVRMTAGGQEYLDACAFFNSRESAQNSINERQRIDATGLRKGMIDPYVRVALVEIREMPEGDM